MSGSVVDRLRRATEKAAALPQPGRVEAAIGLPVSEARLLLAAVEAAKAAAILEHDPSYTDAENREVFLRAETLRHALATLFEIEGEGQDVRSLTSDGIEVDPDEPSDGRDLRGGLLP